MNLDQETVFCKAVYQAMADHGFHISQGIGEYVKNTSDAGWFFQTQWAQLMRDITSAVHLNARSDPLRVVSALSDITHALNFKGLNRYRSLMSRLFFDDPQFKVWLHASDGDSSRSAFAVFMLASGIECRLSTLVNEVTSHVLGVPYALSSSPEKSRDDFLIAAYGPAWCTLYASETMHADHMVERVLKHKPPLVNFRSTLPVVVLPPELTMD